MHDSGAMVEWLTTMARIGSTPVRRSCAAAFVVLALLACKTERKSKNDDIAACQASGGTWVEGGCSDHGRCARPNGAAPDDDVEDDVEDEDVEGEDLGVKD